MMRFFSILSLALVILGGAISAQGQVGQIINPSTLTAGAPTSCSQATALLARLDGAENTSAVTAAVCGMVFDGTYAKLDAIYVGAINSVGNSLIDWTANALNLSSHGTITFTANQGWTSNGTTGYYSSSYVPSTAGLNYTQNAASLGECTVSSRTSGSTATSAGGTDGTAKLFMIPLNSGGATTSYAVNNTTAQTPGAANARGARYVVRTTSSNIAYYTNGVSGGTTTPISNQNLAVNPAILAYNNNGSIVNFDSDQIAYVFFGGLLSSTDVGNLYSRLHNYLQIVGETTAC